MIDFNKTMIDFDRKEYNSIKSISLKANTNINVTSKFINGEVLMFANICQNLLHTNDWCLLFSY